MGPNRSSNGEGRCSMGRNGLCTMGTSRGMGPGSRGKIRRDNAGKGHLPAGTGDNLQRLTQRGEPKRVRGFWSDARVRMSYEGGAMPSEAMRDIALKTVTPYFGQRDSRRRRDLPCLRTSGKKGFGGVERSWAGSVHGTRSSGAVETRPRPVGRYLTPGGSNRGSDSLLDLDPQLKQRT